MKLKEIAKKSIVILTVAGMILGLSGCGSAALTGVGFAESEIVIMQGQSINVAPKYSFSNEAPSEKQVNYAIEQAAIKWQSSDSTIAQVDANGVITANAAGTAVITIADSKGSLKTDLKLKVIPEWNRDENLLGFLNSL